MRRDICWIIKETDTERNQRNRRNQECRVSGFTHDYLQFKKD